MIVQGLLATYSVPVLTYATWNPSDKNASITLSGGDLVASSSSVSWASVRSNISKSTGKWYWEYIVTAIGSGHTQGIGNSSATLANYVGQDANGWGYFSTTGVKTNNAVLTAYGATYTTADIIGVAYDATAGSIEYFKNNVSQGVAFTGLSGSMFAMVGLLGTTTSTLTANFGATALTYSPPSGFNSGLYN